MPRPSHYDVEPRQQLTTRQQHVLELMAKGLTNGQIAEELGITLDGAKFHVSEILARFDVGSREEAVDAWRAQRRPLARMRSSLAGLLTAKFAFGAAGAGAVVGLVAVGALVAMVLNGDDGTQAAQHHGTGAVSPSPAGPPVDRSNVTVDEVIAALQAPGKAVHVVFEGDIDGRHFVQQYWHASDLQATRSENAVNGVLQMVDIVFPDRRALWIPEENSLSDGAMTVAAGQPHPMLTHFPHLSILLSADEIEYKGESVLDGTPVVRFDTVDVRTKDEVYEEPVGTTHRGRIYLRASDLLPVRLQIATEVPGQGRSEFTHDVEVAEYVDLASLPPDLFNPDTLKDAQVTPGEAMAAVGQQPYSTFWLGDRIDVAWHDPRGIGSDHQVVVTVQVAGVAGAAPPPNDTVFVGYGPAGSSTTLIDIRQGRAGSFEPLSSDLLAAIEAAGNITPMGNGAGYFYVEHFPRGTCGFERAQADEECRMGPTGRYGAVLERDGTLVHIVAAPKFDGADPAIAKDTNPFSSAGAIVDLVELLQPVP